MQFDWVLIVQNIVIPTIMAIGIIVTLLTGFAYLSWIERRTLARFTLRYGPNRAGPYGFFQPVADGIKMVFKEELMPTSVDKRIYILAPALTVATSMLAWAVLPVAYQGFELFGFTLPAVLSDVNVGVLYVAAVASLGSYGIVLAGWSSNNKYSLLGALRTSAQLISYELPLGVTLGTLVLITGSMSMVDIVNYQVENGWLIFFPTLSLGGFPIPLLFVGIVAFLTFFISSLAEAGRAPFDLPESENELVSGFMTEYGGIRFALFFMAEYIHMITLSAIATVFFFGGWHGPFAVQFPILGPIYFVLKIVGFLFLMIWIRSSITRLRYDTLMAFCWKFLLPVALINLVVAALLVVFLGL
jgi:NADH-quinone oxidoreductase subunit H